MIRTKFFLPSESASNRFKFFSTWSLMITGNAPNPKPNPMITVYRLDSKTLNSYSVALVHSILSLLTRLGRYPVALPIQPINQFKTVQHSRQHHYSRFEVRLFIIRQNMNFGFRKKIWLQMIADYVYFHVTYHTYSWNHTGWHRSVLNMTHFQLFAWFGQTLLVRKMENKSKFSLGDTIGSKFNFK